jgi:hypothetical protein
MTGLSQPRHPALEIPAESRGRSVLIGVVGVLFLFFLQDVAGRSADPIPVHVFTGLAALFFLFVTLRSLTARARFVLTGDEVLIEQRRFSRTVSSHRVARAAIRRITVASRRSYRGHEYHELVVVTGDAPIVVAHGTSSALEIRRRQIELFLGPR